MPSKAGAARAQMAMPRRASVGRFGLVDASVGASGQTAIPLRGVLSPAYIHTYIHDDHDDDDDD